MTQNTRRIDLLVVGICGGVYLIIHLYAIFFEGYGIFRDELYYLACAAHPAFGYVDHPPLSVWILTILTPLVGNSWQVMRVISALSGLATIYVLVGIIRKLRGNDLACWLVAIAFIFAPINNGYTSYYSMNALELLLWALAFSQLIILLGDLENRNKWAILGLIIGLGMLNKISMAWFVIGMLVYFVMTPRRCVFRQQGLYIAGAIAVLLFTSFVIWNLTHDLAHIEFARNASQFKYDGISRSDFLKQQWLNENPFSIVLLVAGLILLRHHKGKESALMIIFLVTLVILLIKGQVKANYMAPAYLGAFCCGALQISNAQRKAISRYLTAFYLAGYAVCGFLIMPLSIPLLEESTLRQHYAAILDNEKNSEGKEVSELPQFFADMHGWQTFAATVSRAYESLNAEEKSDAVAWVNNYGEAGAIDYYSSTMPLPPVLSRHNNYFLWGLDILKDRKFSVFILIGGDKERYSSFFEEVTQAEEFTCKYCMPYENAQKIYIGKMPKQGASVLEVFRKEKNYN